MISIIDEEIKTTSTISIRVNHFFFSMSFLVSSKQRYENSPHKLRRIFYFWFYCNNEFILALVAVQNHPYADLSFSFPVMIHSFN
jgi:hypothetical protein